MPLHPTIQAIADQTRESGRTSLRSGTVEEARAGYEMLGAVSGPPADLAAIEDRTIPGPAGELPVRIYRPHGDGPLPVCVFFHGGGFTIGSIKSHDIPCQQLAAKSGVLVVSVEYRLAPEHPFPAAPEDAMAATRWIADHANEIGGDGSRLAVAGDSAGGGLAAVVSQQLRDAGGPPLRFQLLIYPTVDPTMSCPSIEENKDSPFLGKDSMVWFFEHYQPDHHSPLGNPLATADLSGLPPALILTGEYDPLRDEGEAYGKRLEEAGVPVTVTRYEGMPHVFFQLAGIVEDGQRAIAQAAAALRDALA